MPEQLLAQWRTRIEAALSSALDRCTGSEPALLAAMRHAVLTGGKRLRPLLSYASGYACGGDEAAPLVDAAATAVELIHAYSLVHDDLPAMDDDQLRRGQPTVHVAFGQAHAILAGDALQTLAFETLASAPLAGDIRAELVAALARAAGAQGMCGGQALDIASTGRFGQTPLSELERLHAMKTGALLRAAISMGAITAHADDARRAALDTYASALGLAFQIKDDLLDIESDSQTLGKTAGKDEAQNKATFPALIGPAASRQRLAELAAHMHAALSPLLPARRAPLDALARLVVERKH